MFEEVMEGEFNNINVNNTNITFSVATNNIDTSDETQADPVYVRQMGTVHSRGKKVATAVKITGITLAFTAVAISGGTLLSNIFVSNPPSISDTTIEVEGEILSYSFAVKNDRKYKTTFYIDIDDKNVYSEDITIAKTYEGSYEPVVSGSRCKAYIIFTNSLDYYKTIYSTEFVAK